MTILHENYENHANSKFQNGNQEHNENLRILLRIKNIMKVLEFPRRITKIMKILKVQLESRKL